MKILFKIAGQLLHSIRADLVRPHAFAAERVGFISCRVGGLKPSGVIILAQDYHPVADVDYLEDMTVGAMMGAGAIRKALEYAYNHKVSMFHVHLHANFGLPKFSKTDLRESEKFVPDFWNVRPEMPHGAIILSYNSIAGRCWYPGKKKPLQMQRFQIVGFPISEIRGAL